MAFYGNYISEHMVRTPEGYLICKQVPIGRSGKIQYLDSELGIGNAGTIITVNREEKENMNPVTLASFEGKPITDGHPDVDVDPTNYNYYQKGHLQNVRSNGKYIYADLFITDETLINEILNGNKREVSCGYDTEYKENNGNLYQTCIRGNHLAVVEEGRAGKRIRINDSADLLNNKLNEINRQYLLQDILRNKDKFLYSKNNKRRTNMSKVGRILTKYKRDVLKVRSVDEMNELIDKTEDALEEALVEENNPNGNLNNPMQQEVTDQDPAIAEIMAAIKSLNAKVDSLVTGAPQSDGTPEGDLQKAELEIQGGIPSPGAAPGEVQEDIITTDENPINEDDKGVTSSKAESALEDVVSVDSKELEPSFEIEEDKTVAKDAALTILRNARKAIANISNPNEKRKVTDAILKSVSSIVNGKNDISNVVRVMNKASDSKWDNNKVANAYAKLNPHSAVNKK